MKVDHLIIGGGIAGVSAAEEIRARDTDATILVLGDERELTYSRVMLPHVARGKTPEARVFLRTREGLEDKRIGFETGVTVSEVDAVGRVVRLADGREIAFGKLLIASGGRARALECPGADDAAVLRFQTLDDTRAIIAANGAKKTLVLGGGFIALELLMAFQSYGAEAVSVTRGTGFFSALGKEAQAMMEAKMAENSVRRITGDTVKEIVREGSEVVVHLGSGAEERVEAVGTGLGLVRCLEFLPAGGPVKTATGVVTNEFLETSVEGIYAAGDVAEYLDVRVGRHRVPGNWQAAMFQGKVAGANMAGERTAFEMLTTYSVSCFGLPIAIMGATDAPEEKIIRVGEGVVVEWCVEKGRVVGASIVGASPDRGAVQKIVAAGMEVTPVMRTQLASPTASLVGLV